MPKMKKGNTIGKVLDSINKNRGDKKLAAIDLEVKGRTIEARFHNQELEPVTKEEIKYRIDDIYLAVKRKKRKTRA